MSNGDIVKFLQPNQKINVQTRGEFIYLKEGLGSFAVIAFDERTEMEAGDNRVFNKPYENFEIENLTSEVRRVVLVCGFGSYDRFIVKGQIQIESSLRASDGSYRPDTRQDLGIILEPKNLVLKSFAKGDIVATSDAHMWNDNVQFFNGVRGKSFMFCGKEKKPTYTYVSWTAYDARTYSYNIKTMEKENLGLNLCAFGVEGRDVAYSPLAGYLFLDSNARVKVVDGMGGQTLFCEPRSNMSGEPRSMFWDWTKERLVVVGFDSATGIFDFSEYNQFGEFIGTAEILGVSRIGFNDDLQGMKARINEDDSKILIALHAGQTSFLVDREKMEFVENYSGGEAVDIANCGGHWGENFIYCPKINDEYVRKIVAFSFVTKPEFRAEKAGCSVLGALKSNEPQTKAEITTEVVSGGVILRGEVIKAAIEFFYKRKAPKNYLDHVYAITASRDAFGLPFKSVSTGNRTFSAAAVPDNFGVLTPSEITIKIDSELQLGGAL